MQAPQSIGPPAEFSALRPLGDGRDAAARHPGPRSAGSFGPRSRRSRDGFVSGDLEHDLAARPASLAELVRVAGVGQRKDLGDVRVQPTGGDELGDRGQRKAVGLGERGGGAQAARRRRLGHVDRRVVRLDGRPVRTEADFAIAVEHDATLIRRADTVVVPAPAGRGPLFTSGRLAPRVAEAIASRPRRARVVSICIGAFVLAAAGVLDGRRATTHWQRVEDFKALFPQVRVDPSALFVDDGDVLTSAGVASGLDVCLHLVRRDHGSEVANHVARLCIVPAWREGARRSSSSAPCRRKSPRARRRPEPGRSRTSTDGSRSATWPTTHT